jgi:hypothetical protein
VAFTPSRMGSSGFGGFGGFGMLPQQRFGGFGMPLGNTPSSVSRAPAPPVYNQPQQNFGGFGGFGMMPQQNFGGFGGFGMMPQQNFGGFGMMPQQNFGGFGMMPQQNFGGFGGAPMGGQPLPQRASRSLPSSIGPHYGGMAILRPGGIQPEDSRTMAPTTPTYAPNSRPLANSIVRRSDDFAVPQFRQGGSVPRGLAAIVPRRK